MLRDALSYGPRQKVRFTEAGEGKAVIARWLQLLVHVSIGGRRGHLRHPSHAAATYIDVGTYLALVRFLRKWGCEQTLAHLCLLFTQALVHGDVSRADAFTLGAAADNVLLCVTAMRSTSSSGSSHPAAAPTPSPRTSAHSRRSSWSLLGSLTNLASASHQGHDAHPHAGSGGGGGAHSRATSASYLGRHGRGRRGEAPRHGALRVEDLRLEHWRAIPPEYIFALGRAMRDDDLEDPARRGEHLETDFKKLLSCATAFFGRPDPALDRLTGEPVFLSCEEAEELDCAEFQRVVLGRNTKRASFP